MSVRAYRVNKIETENNASFNMWRDEKLMDFFEDNSSVWNGLNDDGNGYIEIEVQAIEKALKEFEFGKDDYRKEALTSDLKWSKDNNEDYIMYSCF